LIIFWRIDDVDRLGLFSGPPPIDLPSRAVTATHVDIAAAAAADPARTFAACAPARTRMQPDHAPDADHSAPTPLMIWQGFQAGSI
jgi:hypothetical protein